MKTLRRGVGDQGPVQMDMGCGGRAANGIAALFEPPGEGQVRGRCLSPGDKSEARKTGKSRPAVQGFSSRHRARASAGVA